MVDAPRGDLARSRAGAESMVPTTTSAARELCGVLPRINSRNTVAAVRVPCLSVLAIDAVVQVARPLGDSAAGFVARAVAGSPVIGVTHDPCVSRDMRGRPKSLIVALPETMAIDVHQLRILGWYDNEWGFSARMIDGARPLAAPQEATR